LASATSDGVFVPMGFEFMAEQRLETRFSIGLPAMSGDPPLAKDIAAATAAIGGGAMRSLTGPGHKVTALEIADRGLVLINTDLWSSHAAPVALEDGGALLQPGEVKVVARPAAPPIVVAARARKSAVREAAKAPRVVVEN